MKRATVWTQEGCPLCQKVIDKMKEMGIRFELVRTSDLISGECPDLEAITQLQMQNMELPVIRLESGLITPKEFLDDTN